MFEYKGILNTCLNRWCIIPLLVIANIAALLQFFYLKREFYNNQRLAETGINDFCQRTNLTEFDRSLCFSDRHDQIFFFFNDGVPFFFNKYLLEDSALREYAVGFKGIQEGISLSAPCFRTSLVGRLDNEYAQDMTHIDHLFNQFINNSKLQIDAMSKSFYPTFPNIKKETFHRVNPEPITDAGIDSLCNKEHFIGYDKNNPQYGCSDYLACQFKTRLEAKTYFSQTLQNHLKGMKTDKDGIDQCLNRWFNSGDSLYLYSDQVDNAAHRLNALHKITVEMYAADAANFEIVADHLLINHPNAIIALYSDHGSIEVPFEHEWSNHGYGKNDNTGFLIMLSNKFKDKPKSKELQAVPIESLFSQLALEIRGSNIPKYTVEMPPLKFNDNEEEKLKTYRAREMQLIISLGEEEFADSPFSNQISTNKSLRETVESMRNDLLLKFNDEYRAYLLSKDKKLLAFTSQQVKNHSNTFMMKTFCFTITLLDCFVIAIYFKGLRGAANYQMFSLCATILTLWFCVFILLKGMLDIAIPLVCSGYLILLSTIFWQNKRLKNSKYVLLSRLINFLTFELDQGSLMLIAMMSLMLGVLILAMLTAYQILDYFNLYETLIYPYKPRSAAIGLLGVMIWALILIYKGWMHKVHISEGLDEQNIRKYTSRVRIISMNVLFSLLVLLPLGSSILYEYELQERKFQFKSPLQRNYIKTIYACLVISLAVLPFHKTGHQNYFLFAVGFIFMSFFANHFTRMLFSTIVLPILFFIEQKCQSRSIFKNTIYLCLLMVAQFGLYPANRDYYDFIISQRAFFRIPMKSLDDSVLASLTHFIMIKFSSAIFLMTYSFSFLRHGSLQVLSIITLLQMAFLMLIGGLVDMTESHSMFFCTFVMVNTVPLMIRLMIGSLWSTSAFVLKQNPNLETNSAMQTQREDQTLEFANLKKIDIDENTLHTSDLKGDKITDQGIDGKII